MFTDMPSRSHSLAVRPLPDAYRSMPGTPLGVDPRRPNAVDLAAAMTHAHARMSLEGGDYFLDAPKFPPGTIRPRSPMLPVPGHDWNNGNGYPANGPMAMGNALGFREHTRERDIEDYVRQENKAAALLNGGIMPSLKYAQVYPMRCDDGTLPPDFKSAKTMIAMRTLDNSQLDRIMQAYRLPLDLPGINTIGHHARDSTSSTRVRQAKLQCLLEYLGTYQLIELSGLVLIFVEVPLLLRICPTSEKFDVFIRRFTTNYMRAGMYGLMSLIQWLSLIRKTTSLVAAAVLLLAAAICYLIAGVRGQGFVGSKTLGGQGVAQMIV
ncbi:MAG: hypothetical protein Q9170_002467 [Blastenia crenularia]